MEEGWTVTCSPEIETSERGLIRRRRRIFPKYFIAGILSSSLLEFGLMFRMENRVE